MDLEDNLSERPSEYKQEFEDEDNELDLGVRVLTGSPKNNQKHENHVEDYLDSFKNKPEKTSMKGEKELENPLLQVLPTIFIADKVLKHNLSIQTKQSDDSFKKEEVSLPSTKKNRSKKHIFNIKTEELLETLNYRRKQIEMIIARFSDLKEIIEKVFEKCKFLFEPLDLKDFPEEFNIVDEDFILNYQETFRLDINFERLYKTCQAWHTVCLFPNPLRAKLKLTLREFISLRKIAETDQDLQFLQEMIKKILVQLKKMLNSPKPPTTVKENTVKPDDTVTEVFNFYIKQQKVTIKTQDFDALDLQFKTLTLQKFLFFCKDFKLLKPGKNPKKAAKQIQALQEIFLKNADFSKQMTKTQFLESLSDLSEFFLTKEYDSQHSTQYFSLSPEEKLKKFLRILGLTGKKDLKSKLIGYNLVKLTHPKLSESEIIRKKPEKTKKIVSEFKNEGKKSLSMSINTEINEEPLRTSKKNITMDYLMTTKNNLADLSEFIMEGSSDEEFFKKLEKNKKTNLSQSISSKILARGQELSMIQQKSDNRKADAILNSKFITRVFKYSKK